MPELPEVETTVRGLARVLEGRRIARVEARRADLRRALPEDLGQRLTGARVTGLRPARQIWPDRHRPRRHAGLPSRHVGPLADRSDRDRQARPFADRDRRGAAARAQRRAALRLARSGARPTSLSEWPPFAALGPEPLDLDAERAEAAPRRPHGARSSCCCSTSGSSPGSAISTSARRCTAPGSIRARAGGSISLERLERLVPAIHDGARRGDRGRRLDACATSPAPTASSAISPRASRSMTARGSPARAAERSSASSRAAARPSIARGASADLDVDPLAGRGARRVGASLWAAPLFI